MDADLRLEVATSSQVYHSDDQIIARVYLFNLGDDAITLNTRFALSRANGPGEVAFVLVGPRGKDVPFAARVNVGQPDADDFSQIVPWHCAGCQYDLQPYFAPDQPGKYTLKAIYANKWSGEEAGLDAWQGRLESNTITLEIADGQR